MESRNYGNFTLIGTRESNKMKNKFLYFIIDDSEIPDGVLMEILLRLPLKTIFKFKCVSKRWLSVISDPYFVNLFLARMEKEGMSPVWDLLYCHMFDGLGEIPAKDMVLRLTLNHHPDFEPRKFSLEFLTSEVQPQNQPIKVLATSNGLILCCKTLWLQANYYICNPLTTQWVSLPQPPLVHQSVSIGFSCGDGSYRLVRIVQSESSDFSTILKLEIFSSDTGQWREQTLSCPQLVSLFMRCSSAIVYNEIMHWVAHHSTIIAYDSNVNSDKCRLINLPKDGQSLVLGVLGLCCERLCYINTDLGSEELFADRCVRVWVLKDYDSGEWCMRFKTRLIDIASLDDRRDRVLNKSYFCLIPLAIHPFDTDIIYLRADYCIASYNPQTNTLKAIITDKMFHRGFLTDATAFPFVLPPWPTLIPQPIPSELK